MRLHKRTWGAGVVLLIGGGLGWWLHVSQSETKEDKTNGLTVLNDGGSIEAVCGDTLCSESTSVAKEKPYDWTPQGFKEEHYDEWYVVKHCIDEQQDDNGIDFPAIDSLVRNYTVLRFSYEKRREELLAGYNKEYPKSSSTVPCQ